MAINLALNPILCTIFLIKNEPHKTDFSITIMYRLLKQPCVRISECIVVICVAIRIPVMYGAKPFKRYMIREPAWWMHLQFGLFSIPSSGPQLVHQRMWESVYKRSRAAYRKHQRDY